MGDDARPIRLAAPWVGEEELAAVGRVLASGRLVMGPRVEEFEAALRARAGVRHALCVNSGTNALYLLLRALGVGAGDEVIVPALTFPAAAEVVLLLGAVPVFADVSPRTFNLDPARVAGALTARTRALVAVDQFGLPADYPAIEEALGGRAVALVEDAACAIGSTLRGRPCGAFGRGAILSFHPRKVVTTGEGGAVLTDDGGLAREVGLLRNHGMTAPGSFAAAGFNCRMAEIEGALGLCQLGRLDAMIGARAALAARYRGRLDGLLRFQEEAPEGTTNNQSLVAVLPGGDDGGARRGEVLRRLREERIELQVASYCVPLLPPYARCPAPGGFEESRRVHERGVTLPLSHEMTADDVLRVCEALARALEATA